MRNRPCKTMIDSCNVQIDFARKLRLGIYSVKRIGLGLISEKTKIPAKKRDRRRRMKNLQNIYIIGQ